MIVAHLGGMYRWEGVERYLSGLRDNVYFDLGFVAGEIGEKQLVRLISKHGADKILLGSDCPWDDPANEIAMIENIPLGNEEKELIFYKNALKILKLDSLKTTIG
jgi:predicted TIM-barrel fold metal-dependent hydrolase